MSKKKSWAVQFKEFRVFAECVLDYLRSQVLAMVWDNMRLFQGMNAHFVLRIATDRDWAADVRAQVQPSQKTSFIKILLHFLKLFCFFSDPH